MRWCRGCIQCVAQRLRHRHGNQHPILMRTWTADASDSRGWKLYAGYMHCRIADIILSLIYSFWSYIHLYRTCNGNFQSLDVPSPLYIYDPRFHGLLFYMFSGVCAQVAKGKWWSRSNIRRHSITRPALIYIYIYVRYSGCLSIYRHMYREPIYTRI